MSYHDIRLEKTQKRNSREIYFKDLVHFYVINLLGKSVIRPILLLNNTALYQVELKNTIFRHWLLEGTPMVLFLVSGLLLLGRQPSQLTLLGIKFSLNTLDPLLVELKKTLGSVESWLHAKVPENVQPP